MASDLDFNKKSCTTGHTGFGVPYATDPDHSDVPRSAARPLRYMDQYFTTTQGEVMYMTEMLANLEGIERGPAEMCIRDRILGSAGAINQEFYARLEEKSCEYPCYALELTDLHGGHTGLEIGSGYANALTILTDVMFKLVRDYRCV